MNRLTMAATALALSAGTVLGAPRESVTFNGVPSFDLFGNAGNSTQLHTFAGSDGGGSYTATYLTVSGAISGAAGVTFSREACIFVTPPGGGTPFIIQPYNGAATWTGALATTAGRYAVPVGAFTTAGEWSFQFFEQFNDVAGNDCMWDTVTLTLEDGAIPTAPAGNPLLDVQSQTWAGVDSDGVAATPGSTRTIAFNAGPDVSRIRINGLCTGRTPFAANFNANTLSQVLVRVTPPGQAAVVLTPFTATAFSTDSSVVTATLTTPASSSGTWTVDFYESTDTAGGVDNIWNNVTLTIGNPAPTPPPPSTDLGAITAPDRTEVVAITAAGQIKWYKITLTADVTDAAGNWLDIDTEGTGAPIVDTEVGVYTSAGNLVSSDDDDGTGNLTQLSFGQTAPVRPYAGTTGGNGRDGGLVAGVYYVAVGVFNVVFNAAEFNVTSTGTAVGNINLNFHTNIPGGPTGCNAADVAGLGGSIGPDGQLTADDVVVYLAAFFSNDLAVADIAVLGGAPGADGQLTADDIVYFLSQFFSPCN
ncbi:MAG: GC-type dockerin domain-anchored protein [Phycisphaerales bacterium]